MVIILSSNYSRMLTTLVGDDKGVIFVESNSLLESSNVFEVRHWTMCGGSFIQYDKLPFY